MFGNLSVAGTDTYTRVALQTNLYRYKLLWFICQACLFNLWVNIYSRVTSSIKKSKPSCLIDKSRFFKICFSKRHTQKFHLTMIGHFKVVLPSTVLLKIKVLFNRPTVSVSNCAIGSKLSTWARSAEVTVYWDLVVFILYYVLYLDLIPYVLFFNVENVFNITSKTFW